MKNNTAANLIIAQNYRGDFIEPALNHFQYSLKGISLLPKQEGVYEQPPFEPITREEYLERTKHLKQIDFSGVKNQKAVGEVGCSNDGCEQKVELETLSENKRRSLESHFEGARLFTSPGCKVCSEIKSELESAGIDYREFNIGIEEEKKEFNKFYSGNREKIQRGEENTIKFPILSMNREVLQGKEKIMPLLKQ